MLAYYETSLKASVYFSGVGVHTGLETSVAIHPASPRYGVRFVTNSTQSGSLEDIKASYENVISTQLCTTLGKQECRILTVEHILSALYACGITNAQIEVNGAEIPILDGSAKEYVEAFQAVGITTFPQFKKLLKVLRPVRVEHENAFSELLPVDSGFHVDLTINFQHPRIGTMRRFTKVNSKRYIQDIAAARTFGMLKDVDAYRTMGYAKGSSYDNTLVLDHESVLNTEGLRYNDEFVRHKILDAVGDLSLAGYALCGLYRSYCGGHALNVRVLQKLFSSTEYYSLEEYSLQDYGLKGEGEALDAA